MPQLQQARALETREKILRGAAEVFATKGYEGATIADILATCGVTKGAMYFHFKSKEELGRAIVGLQADLVHAFEVSEDNPAAQQLVDISMSFADALLNDLLVRASVRLTTEGHGFDEEQRVAFDAWLDLATKLARLGIAEGSIQDHWTPVAVAEALTTSVNGIQHSSSIYSGYSDMRRRLVQMWRMITPGLFTVSGASSISLPTV